MSQLIHPSPVAYKDIDLAWLAGRAVCEVSFHEPIWWFDFGSEIRVSVECLWRVVEHRRVILTSQDHGHQFGLPAPVDAIAKCTELFSKRRVVAVQLREATADLLIEFTDDLRLEIIPDSAGYESWQLRDPSGTSFVAQGGGRICKW
jgi:hypothetical protein